MNKKTLAALKAEVQAELAGNVKEPMRSSLNALDSALRSLEHAQLTAKQLVRPKGE